MRLIGEHIRLGSRAQGMQLILEDLELRNQPLAIVRDKILSFLSHKGVDEGVQLDVLQMALEHPLERQRWMGSVLVQVPVARMEWEGGAKQLDKKEAITFSRELESSSREWLNGCAKKRPAFFKEGEQVARVTRPSPKNCLGESSRTWDPVEHLELDESLLWQEQGEFYHLVATHSGYLMAKKGCYYIHKLDTVSDDAMERRALILPPQRGQKAWREMSESLLASYGIDTSPGEGWILLEKGKDPIPAVPGELEVLAPAQGYWHQEVQEGDVLATLTPPKISTPGWTVLGQPFPSNDVEAPAIDCPSGEGVLKETLPDGRMLYIAKHNGVATRKEGILQVQSVLRIDGDLHLNQSPIRFSGKVSIGGDVLCGSEIECGEIKVEGMVENHVRIKGKKSVHVKGGVVGERTTLSAESIEVHHVQSSTLKADKKIFIEAFSHGASLMCMGNIEVQGTALPGDQKAVVGGSCSAFGKVQIRSAGSPMCSTLLASGIDLPLWESCEQARSLARQLHRDISELQTQLPLKVLRTEGTVGLEEEERELVKTTLKKIKQKLTRRKHLLKKLNENSEKCYNPTGGSIEIQDGLFPDTAVMIGSAETLHRRPRLGATTLINLEGKIVNKST